MKFLAILPAIAITVVWVLAIIGWVLNIIKLCSLALAVGAAFVPELFLRIVGVFVAPLGAVLGWF